MKVVSGQAKDQEKEFCTATTIINIQVTSMRINFTGKE